MNAANCSGGAPAGPPTLAVAGLAAAELRAAPMVLALDPRIPPSAPAPAGA